MNKTAVIYARVSTKRQFDEELPLQSQLEHCRKKAAELGAEVLNEYTDDGVSGRSAELRHAFQSAIAFCEMAAVDYFVCWSSSRFARSVVDAGIYKLRLAKVGTELVYTSMSIDRKTDSGWLTETVLEAFNEFTSRQTASDTIRSMVKNARAGYWNGGVPPYGYRPAADLDNPKRKRLQPVPSEASTVRQIFQRRADGWGARSIAIWLNDRGYNNRGRSWNKGTVGALLRNEAVIGHVVFGRKERGGRRTTPRNEWIIVPSHEPIIDLAVFECVQRQMDELTNNQSSPKSEHVFTGLLRCGHCGSALQIETATGRSQTYSYYGCRRRRNYGDCGMRAVPSDRLDQFLVDHICSAILTPDNLAQVVTDLQKSVVL